MAAKRLSGRRIGAALRGPRAIGSDAVKMGRRAVYADRERVRMAVASSPDPPFMAEAEGRMMPRAFIDGAFGDAEEFDAYMEGDTLVLRKGRNSYRLRTYEDPDKIKAPILEGGFAGFPLDAPILGKELKRFKRDKGARARIVAAHDRDGKRVAYVIVHSGDGIAGGARIGEWAPRDWDDESGGYSSWFSPRYLSSAAMMGDGAHARVRRDSPLQVVRSEEGIETSLLEAPMILTDPADVEEMDRMDREWISSHNRSAPTRLSSCKIDGRVAYASKGRMVIRRFHRKAPGPRRRIRDMACRHRAKPAMRLITVYFYAFIRLIMTTVIRKDKEWLREEIECGIQGFIEMNMESICSTVMNEIYKQIYLSACEMNSEIETDAPAKLVIEVDIPRPDECAKAIYEL